MGRNEEAFRGIVMENDKKVKMPIQDAKKRINNFLEVELCYSD